MSPDDDEWNWGYQCVVEGCAMKVSVAYCYFHHPIIVDGERLVWRSWG